MSWTIQELGLGEVLDHAFQLFKRCFHDCILTALVIAGPISVLSVFVELSEDAGMMTTGVADFWIFLLFFVSVLFLQPLAYGIILPIFAGEYLGTPVTRQQAFRLARQRYLPLVITRVLRYTAVILGLVFLFIPGFILYILFYFVEEVIILEDRSYFSAINRSAKLAGKAFGLVLVTATAFLVVSIFVQLSVDGIEAPLLRLALLLATGILFIPLEIVMNCVVYFSARCSKDQFDLELAIRKTDPV